SALLRVRPRIVADLGPQRVSVGLEEALHLRPVRAADLHGLLQPVFARLAKRRARFRDPDEPHAEDAGAGGLSLEQLVELLLEQLWSVGIGGSRIARANELLGVLPVDAEVAGEGLLV